MIGTNLYANRRFRKNIAAGSGNASTTVTWGTEIPSDAWGFIINTITYSFTAAGVTGTTTTITVDGGAAIFQDSVCNGYTTGMGTGPFGFLVKKSDGSIANPVVTFSFVKTGGTCGITIEGFWLYEGDA